MKEIKVGTATLKFKDELTIGDFIKILEEFPNIEESMASRNICMAYKYNLRQIELMCMDVEFDFNSISKSEFEELASELLIEEDQKKKLDDLQPSRITRA